MSEQDWGLNVWTDIITQQSENKLIQTQLTFRFLPALQDFLSNINNESIVIVAKNQFRKYKLGI